MASTYGLLTLPDWSDIVDLANAAGYGQISAAKQKELETELIENMRKAGATPEQIQDALDEMRGFIKKANEENRAKSALPDDPFKKLFWVVLAVFAVVLFIKLK
jgi:hypothetical protein